MKKVYNTLRDISKDEWKKKDNKKSESVGKTQLKV